MSQALEDRVRALPCWAGPIVFERLMGGVSNVSYLVTDAEERKFVARMGDDIPAHHVSREREIEASRAAHAAGFSPEVVLAEPGVIVLRFLEARRYTEADVRANAFACTKLIRAYHTDLAARVIGPPAIFWVFHVLRDYSKQLVDAGHLHAGEVPRWLPIVSKLEAAQMPLPIVYGHHDLLPTNLLDDGKKLWLIDWEYGAFGTAMFDLANLAANNSFGRMEEHVLLETYFGKPPQEALWRAFDAMKVASALREATWGMISGLYVRTPGIDYVAYAEEFLGRFETVLAAYEFKYGKL